MLFSSCNCCDCTAGTTKITGKVTLQCSYRGQAGTVVTATGPDSLSTTTDASGNYSFTLVKKGTYTITAHGPCGDQSQTVAKPTCGTTTANVNFTFESYNVSITMNWLCYDPDNGPRPKISFGIPESFPTSPPTFGEGSNVVTRCVQPGDYLLRVWDDNCFVGQDLPITVGCGDYTTSMNLESKKYKVKVYVHSCTTDGLDGVSVTVTATDGTGGSGVTDGDGRVEIPGITQGCYYDISLSKERWKDITYANVYKYCWDGDVIEQDHRLNMEPADGYTCFGLCCKYPAKLSIVDAQGTHPITLGAVGPGGGGYTACITTTKPGYPSAVDFGVFGILCRPEGAESDQAIAYRYQVLCSYTDTGGQWSVSRFSPGCMVDDGVTVTYHFAASYCGPSGSPVASSGTTAYISDGGTQPSPNTTCGPMTLSFSDGIGLGDFQLISE